MAARRACTLTQLPGGDRGKTPHVKEPQQPLVADRVVRGIDRLVVLAEELLALSFGEVSQDHQRIGGSSVDCAVTGLSFTPAVTPSLPAAPARTQTLQVRV